MKERQKKVYTLKEKEEILRKVDVLSHMNLRHISEILDVSISTLSLIIKEKNNIKNGMMKKALTKKGKSLDCNDNVTVNSVTAPKPRIQKKPLTVKKKSEILQALDEQKNYNLREASKTLNVSISSLSRIISERKHVNRLSLGSRPTKTNLHGEAKKRNSIANDLQAVTKLPGVVKIRNSVVNNLQAMTILPGEAKKRNSIVNDLQGVTILPGEAKNCNNTVNDLNRTFTKENDSTKSSANCLVRRNLLSNFTAGGIDSLKNRCEKKSLSNTAGFQNKTDKGIGDKATKDNLNIPEISNSLDLPVHTENQKAEPYAKISPTKKSFPVMNAISTPKGKEKTLSTDFNNVDSCPENISSKINSCIERSVQLYLMKSKFNNSIKNFDDYKQPSSIYSQDRSKSSKFCLKNLKEDQQKSGLMEALRLLRQVTEKDPEPPLWYSFAVDRLLGQDVKIKYKSKEKREAPSNTGICTRQELMEALWTLQRALRSKEGPPLWLSYALASLFKDWQP